MRNKNKNIMLDLEKITLNVREIALRAGAFLGSADFPGW